MRSNWNEAVVLFILFSENELCEILCPLNNDNNWIVCLLREFGIENKHPDPSTRS